LLCTTFLLIEQASAVPSYARQTPHTNANDNFTINQISGFVAGRITHDLEIFSQVTYDGVGKGTAIDNVDIRLAHDFVIAKTDVILGVSVNDNPGVSDPGNRSTTSLTAPAPTTTATGATRATTTRCFCSSGRLFSDGRFL
jgi:hypothetical protein